MEPATDGADIRVAATGGDLLVVPDLELKMEFPAKSTLFMA
jgi:hypothetical protein